MFELAKRASGLFMDLPPDTLFGAMLLALVVAIGTASAYRWMARPKPSSLTLLVFLVLLANLACIVATVSLVHSTVPTVRTVALRGRQPQARVVNLYDHFSPPDAARSAALSPQHP
jgi:predicted PurR-regulated permease PerM